MRNLALRVIFVGLLLSLAGYFFLLKGGGKPAHTPLSDTGTTRKSAALIKKQPLVLKGGDKPTHTPLSDTGIARKSVPIFKIPSVFSRGQFPRDPDESQKTRLNTQFTMRCNTTEDCCAAKACIKGICTGCSTSTDCMADETCAIDHCIPRQQATCETRHDCESGDHCVLSRQKNNAKRGVFFSGKNCRNNKKFSSRCEKKRWNDPKPHLKFKLRGFSEWGPPELLLEWKMLELSEGRLTVNLVVTPLRQHDELVFRYATQKRRGQRYDLPRNKGYQFIELFDVKAEPTVIVENLVVPSYDNGFFYLDAEIYYRNAAGGREEGRDSSILQTVKLS